MNDVNLAPENKEATPEHGYLMAYDKKEQKAKGVKGIAANGELETLEANEANRDQFIKVDQRGNFFTNFGKNFLYQYNPSLASVASFTVSSAPSSLIRSP